jgi:hypothetical protein
MKKEKTITHKVELTDQELLLLDGKINPTAQEEVDDAKLRIQCRNKYLELPQIQTDFIATTLKIVNKEKKLIFRDGQFSYCPICNKGSCFGKNPPTFWGKDLQDSFVSWKNMPNHGGCSKCINSILPHLKQELKEIKAELPSELASTEFLYQRFRKAACSKCKWKGHDGELKSGLSCPKCGAENGYFGHNECIKIDQDKFVLLIKNSIDEVKKLIKMKAGA